MNRLKMLAAGIILLASCRAMNSADQPKLEETKWQLVAMDKKPADFGERATLMFDAKENKVSGKAACNSFFSEYERSGSKLTFTQIGSTKMFCEGMMDKENQIISNLQKVKKYEIKYGLLYLSGSDDLLLTYKKVN